MRSSWNSPGRFRGGRARSSARLSSLGPPGGPPGTRCCARWLGERHDDAAAHAQAAAPALALSRDDQPLQLPVRDVHSHLRRTRTAEGSWVGGVPPRRRSVPGPRARLAARHRRAALEPSAATNDPAPEGTRSHGAVQLQRDHARPPPAHRPHRERTGRAPRLARRDDGRHVRADPRRGRARQGDRQPRRLCRSEAACRQRPPAGHALVHGPQGQHRGDSRAGAARDARRRGRDQPAAPRVQRSRARDGGAVAVRPGGGAGRGAALPCRDCRRRGGRRVHRVRRRGARGEPDADARGSSVERVPSSLHARLRHRPRQRAAVLHRSVHHPALRRHRARQSLRAVARGTVVGRAVSPFSRGHPDRSATRAVPGLRSEVEPVTRTRPIAVAIMAKAPLPGQVKTRLCPPLSPDEAAGLYRCFLLDKIQQVRALARARPVIAYAPEEAGQIFGTMAPDLELLPQRGADLGVRLTGILERLLEAGHDGAVAIDSDTPTLPIHLLQQAVDRLADDPALDGVLGPTEDGGYYLIGLKAPQPVLFTDMPWSTADVLPETIRRAEGRRLRLAQLRPWYDVDTPEDLDRLRSELASTEALVAPFTRRFFQS